MREREREKIARDMGVKEKSKTEAFAKRDSERNKESETILLGDDIYSKAKS